MCLKIKEALISALGRASKLQNNHCLVFPMLPSGSRDVFVDRNAQLKDLYGAFLPFPGLFFGGRMSPLAVYTLCGFLASHVAEPDLEFIIDV